MILLNRDRESFEICAGCRLSLPIFDGPTQSYIGASPSCRALFGQLLARGYGDAAYMKVHQLTVDASPFSIRELPSRGP